ncbi:sporulation integral membrane protein YtvI [Metabacillus sp. GX 13764]|uniref:sporulation integral membrane protein YtvI n=1 Tax=Metabacillus kandeliae TaxID=2900151 RepID=UPI001E3C0CC4|nr:sporulation integral membrane protein YtvI [Metabacillus kandeliae]
MKHAYRIAARAGFVAAGAAAAFFIIAVSFPLLYPFYAAALLAYFLNPSVNFLTGKMKFPRGISSAVMLFLLLAAASALLISLLAELAAGLKYLASVFPFYLKHFIAYSQSFFSGSIVPFGDKLAELYNSLEEGHKQTIMTNLQSAMENALKEAASMTSRMLNALPAYISALPAAGSIFFLVVLSAFFISKDWYKLGASLKKKLPPRMQEKVQLLRDEIKRAVAGLIKAQLCLMLITIILSYIGLLILRIPHSLAVAFMIGLMDFIPFVGSGIIFFPWIAYLLLSGGSKLASGIGVLFLVVIIVRQLLEPKLMSKSAGVPPLPALLALFAGYKLFGLLGLFAGPLIIVLASSLYKAGIWQAIWSFIVKDD